MKFKNDSIQELRRMIDLQLVKTDKTLQEVYRDFVVSETVKDKHIAFIFALWHRALNRTQRDAITILSDIPHRTHSCYFEYTDAQLETFLKKSFPKAECIPFDITTREN